jgi:hypothetical protein
MPGLPRRHVAAKLLWLPIPNICEHEVESKLTLVTAGRTYAQKVKRVCNLLPLARFIAREAYI